MSTTDNFNNINFFSVLDAVPIWLHDNPTGQNNPLVRSPANRTEAHTSERHSPLLSAYAEFGVKKKIGGGGGG
ncbi:hypothetical protein, partial [Klebsiella quasipneumoniae]|uniref:hypothetical protein n=1 Tax=Klebsiella quasipneumoniae TaxID=1463165 RepID=UPI002117B3DB